MVTELNALKEAVAALTTKTDGLQENVTDIETVVNQIASGGSGSASGIRRIQRDKFTITPYTDPPIEISLTGFSNLNKMIVILNSYCNKNSGLAGNCVYLYELTLNKLSIIGPSDSNISGSYQVIEFN